MDVVSAIMAYENGDLGHDDTVALFQHLIDNGAAWSMQGSYGRAARYLIDSGECTAPRVGV